MNDDSLGNYHTDSDSSAPVIYKSTDSTTDVIVVKRKNRFLRWLLNFVIVIVIVAVLVFGVLYAIKVIAGYDSIKALVDVMSNELLYIWKRIIKAE